MTKLHAISRFSPGNCDPAFLESITVGREELLPRLEKAVAASARSGAGHHCLIVGPRGAGKTHLIALLRDRVHRNQALRKRVVIAYLKEEERGVAHFLDWLVRILQSFVRHEEAGPELAAEIDQLMDMEHEAARDAAERILVRFVGKRRLLLLVENLGEIFSSKKGMGREGQQRFRDLVQQHPFWTIVATTQALFDDVQTRDAPFYGFFKIQHLQPFEFEQAALLLDKLAEADKRPKLRKFLQTSAARGRIRAVHDLTGGSPRLLVIFYQFIDADSVDDLSRSFLDMVDSLTSYYQERMHMLSAGQQKIVELLCNQRSPATVKQIARHCFITPQSASSELKRLADARYVTAHKVGRESYYELSEPLFRICFEVKENRGHPVRLFVDFLGSFYTLDELERKYRSAYLLSLLYKHRGRDSDERRERERLLYVLHAAATHHGIDVVKQWRAGGDDEFDFNAFIGDLIAQSDYRELARVTDAILSMEFVNARYVVLSARSHRELGDLAVARQRVDELMRVAPGAASTWSERAMLELASDDSTAAEASYRRALEIDPERTDALMGLAAILLRDVKINADDFLRSWALVIGMRNGSVQAPHGDQDVLASEAMHGLFGNLKHLEEACSLLERAGARAHRAWGDLSLMQLCLGKWEASLQSARAACTRTPDVPRYWAVRAAAALLQRLDSEALESQTRVTELMPDDATALMNLAFVQERTGDIEAALASMRRVTQQDSGDAMMWLSRARLASVSSYFDEARSCFEKAAEQPRIRPLVYWSAATLYFAQGRYEEGLVVSESIVALGLEADEEGVALIVLLVGLSLFVTAPIELLTRFLERHHAVFRGAGQARAFLASVSQALTILLQSRDTIPLERLQALATVIVPALARHEELAVMSRLFATAVRYASEKDERILMELPLEERRVLAEMLTPRTEPEPSA